MIRKILETFRIENPRFPDVLKTLERVVLGHAWFEDEFLLPALRARPLVFQPFRMEIQQEHQDIAALLHLLRKTAFSPAPPLKAYVLTLRTLLETHFAKEEDALFPLAEKVITQEGLVDMAAEMERRKSEVRNLPPK